ncbi:MAG: anthranilate synthase component I family protein [Phycisphaerae bacterium]|jgi:para-aminobenzoate synthetase component 1
MARILTNAKIFADVEVSSLAHFFSSLPNPAILTGGRCSYFAAEPAEIFEFKIGDKNPFEKLRTVLSKYRIEKTDCPIDNDIFTIGWIGFFSYDLNQYIETIILPAKDDLKLPLIRLCFYDKVICFDSLEKCFHLFAIEPNGSEKIAQLKDILNQAATVISTPAASCQPPRFTRSGAVGETRAGEKSIEKQISRFACGSLEMTTKAFQSNMTKDYYLQSIAKVKKYIYDGDVYQINFSQRFSKEIKVPDTFNSVELFLWQNKFNPSPYAAFIDAGDYQIISASPELFININAGTITTSPIKGTRPRTGNKIIDAKNYAELLACEKELAELDMITDLERNDLGRICKPGSIKVTDRREIETFATVFHAISTIEGEIKPGLDFIDCLKAVFPGGSISGAPKISAMNIINSLEPTARGIYTGSIGWIDLRGNASLNIVIRTILVKAGVAYAQTGGGIVADSKPDAEWHETLVKAKALLASLNAVNKKK